MVDVQEAVALARHALTAEPASRAFFEMNLVVVPRDVLIVLSHAAEEARG